MPLDSEELAQLQRALACLIGDRVYLVHGQDPRLLGGISVTLGDRRIDASLLGRVHNLHDTLGRL